MAVKDVELVIRARQEGGKALEEFTAGVKELLGLQSELSASSTTAAGGLSELGQELAAIGREVKNLQAFGQVVNNLDKAAAAVDRLEGRVARTTKELQQLSESQHRLAAATAKAGDAAAAAAKSYDAQRARAAEVRRESGKTSDAYKAQAAAVLEAKRRRDEANASLARARKEESSVNTAIRKTAEALDADTRSLAGAQQAWEDLYAASSQASAGLKGVTASQEDVARAAEHAAEKLKLTKGAIDFRRQADEAKRLRDAADYVDFWTKALGEKEAAEQAAVQANDRAQAAAGKGGAGNGTFLGLRPYELHSLSYQINDVFTQLASGTPVMQVAAQQGGQLFQVFQRQLIPVFASAGPAMAALAPEIALVAAAFAVLFGVLKNIGDRAKSVKEFNADLAASADGVNYNAQALAEAAHQLDVAGGSLAEARAALNAAVKEGLNPDLLETFGRTAQNMAKVTGEEVPTAAKKMAEAFTGGYDAIVRLDDEMNFLSATERKRIKDLMDSGQAERARSEAFAIFSRRMADGASKMKGPWSQAVGNLARAWDNMLAFFENSAPIKGAIKLLGDLAEVAADLSEKLPGAAERAAESAALAAGSTIEITRLQREITKLEGERARAIEDRFRVDSHGGQRLITGAQQNNLRAPGSAGGRSVEEINAEITKAQQRLASLQSAMQDVQINGTEEQKKAVQEALDGINRERAQLGDLTDQQKIRIEGEIAYQDEIRNTGNVAIATAKKQLAMQREIERQRQAINYGRLTQKIIGAETGGSANPTSAKNPNSSATGLGQFIESTWLRMFKQYFPDRAKSMSEEAILALRKDAELSKAMVEAYARENADVLKTAGLAVNDAALYLAHFLGPQGAVKVLKAAADKPVAQLLDAQAIAANPTVLKGKTAGDVVDFARRKVGVSDDSRARLDAQAEAADVLLKNEREREKAQTDLNTRLEEEVRQRNEAARAARETTVLMGEARIQAEREVAIRQALAQAEADAKKASDAELLAGRQKLQLTDAQRKAIEAAAAAEFDAAHAAETLVARRTVTEDAVNTTLERRQILLEQIDLAQRKGETERAATLITQYDALGVSLDNAILKAQEFWAAIAGDPAQAAMLGLTAQQIENIRLALDTSRQSATGLKNEFLMTGKQINESIANRGAQAFDQFAQAVAGGRNVFKSVKEAFLSFAADFMRQIAQMIIQQIIFNIVSSAFGGSSSGAGGVGGSLSGWMSSTLGGVTKKHSGGLVDSGSLTAPAAWFANAARYHSGGVVGLKPGEVPAILKKNEEVLTEDDPRHVFNGGGKGGAEDRIRIVNMIDAGDMLTQGLNSRVGEKELINHVRANAGAIRNALGIG